MAITQAPPTSDPGALKPAALIALSAALGALAVAAIAHALQLPDLLIGLCAGAALAGAVAAGILAGRTDTATVAAVGPGAIVVTDLDGTVETTSAAFAALMSARRLPLSPDALAADPRSAATLYSLRRRAIAGGHAEGVLSDGTLLAVAFDAGRLIHTFEAAPEVSSAPAAPAATVAASLVEVVPSPAAVIDTAGAIVAANEGFSATLGATDTLAEAIAVDAAGIVRLAAQARSAGTARLDAAIRATPERRVRLTARHFAGDQLIVALTDVTEQSELEAHMAQSQKMQAIGQLAGGIAHDFNNVLTAIIGFSDLLLQNHRPSDPAFRDIMNIKQSAQRAAGLVKQLLAFSRRQTLRPTVLNLNDVVADLSMMLDRLLGEPVRLEIAFGRDLWPVTADLSQIEQVVINLAVNARDAMPGGGTLKIRTRNVPQGAAEAGDDALDADAVVVEIEDVGTGMPQHVLEKIFEPFFTTKATGEGTGLGLSTVYGIVKQTGGSLAVASEEGVGTTFRVYLPRATVEPRAAEPVRAEAAAPTDLTGNATLLLVEDEEAIRAIAARALSAKGYRVLSASSGLEAAEIFAERGAEIDLLLTDVIMPELDGPSLVKQIRAERPDLKVIFMSGYADGASVDDLGGARFLPKPFTLKALAEAVKQELVTI